MKKFSFLPKSSPVQPHRPLQAKFYKTFKHIQNQRGTNSAKMYVKKSVWNMSNFQDLPKKPSRNPTSTQHSFLFSCSEDIKLSFSKTSLKRMKITDQRTNGPVNAHLISWPSKAQNIQNLENKR